METRIIIVAGPAASGKTSLIHWLKNRHPNLVSVLPIDNYYYALDHMPEEERHFVNYDHPDSIEWTLLEEHLKMLKKGKTVECPNYCYVKQTRIQPSLITKPKPIILLDGLLTLSIENIRKLANTSLFIDTPIDICLARKIKRDIEERGRTIEQSTRQYLKMTRPMYYQFVLPSRQYADLILPGSKTEKLGLLLEQYLFNTTTTTFAEAAL